MKRRALATTIRSPLLVRLLAGALLVCLAGLSARGQTMPATNPAATPPAPPSREITAAAIFRGRTVERVDVRGNAQVHLAEILNVIRTHEGDKFDPDTVNEDYQRIYKLRRFSNVRAMVEPTTDGGVVVVFEVSEEKQVREIRYVGNKSIDTIDIQRIVNFKTGEAIDTFRIASARQNIERLYHDKNYPFAHVEVDIAELARSGSVVFNIVEGPNLRVRKVDFNGNNSFSTWKLKDQIKTAYWIFIFRPGTFDPEQVDDDVASLRKFYNDKGFFDARVGRKLIFSPDQTEMQVTYVIDEGQRYTIDKVVFKGATLLSEDALRKKLKLLEGQQYDKEVLDRDLREIVREYSPYGLIYDPQLNDPDYLRIDTKPVFKKSAGKIDLIYDIHEGRRFRVGRILVRGNGKTQDKVILRELREFPGQVYDSGQFLDAVDRLRGTPYFSGATITPIGEDPDVRDVLVDVTEQRTASIQAGIGINSNGGVGGQIAYEQKNFDIGNPPATFGDFFSERAFTGAGQNFRAEFAPGTTATNASIRFTEPYLFDQPYSFTNEAYLRDRERENYLDRRLGDRITLGKRFDYIWSTAVTLRGEDVKIYDIQDPPERAQEINDGKGHHTLTSIAWQLRRDTTNHGPITFQGNDTTFGVEQYGALGGQVDFTKLTLSSSFYQTVQEDLLDRRTVINYHADIGYVPQNAPFYESFYGGGIGSIRGFAFRGVSPRQGPQDDQIGGNFSITGGVELGFPIAADVLRGVIFTDLGDVEHDFHFGVIRSSVGFGFRLSLPYFGQVPLALDFGFPIIKSDQDDTQIISFSLGVSR